MKWQGRRGSDNIEDRRARGGARRAGGVGGVGAIVLLLAGWYFGVDVSGFVGGGGGAVGSSQQLQITPEDERAAEFVSVTLADTEEVWTDVFRQQVGKPYDPPVLVLFKGSTQSACGGLRPRLDRFIARQRTRSFSIQSSLRRWSVRWVRAAILQPLMS